MCLVSLQGSITLPAQLSGASGRDDLLLGPSRSFVGCVRGLGICPTVFLIVDLNINIRALLCFNSRLEYRYSCLTVILIVDLNLSIRALL